MSRDDKAIDQTAFEALRRWPDKMVVWLTADGKEPLKGRICRQPDPKKVVVFVGAFAWFEFTEESDIEIESIGRIHVVG